MTKKLTRLADLSTQQAQHIQVIADPAASAADKARAREAMAEIDRQAEQAYFGGKKLGKVRRSAITRALTTWIESGCTDRGDVLYLSEEHPEVARAVAKLDRSAAVGDIAIVCDDEVEHRMDGYLTVTWTQAVAQVRYEDFGASFSLVVVAVRGR